MAFKNSVQPQIDPDVVNQVVKDQWNSVLNACWDLYMSEIETPRRDRKRHWIIARIIHAFSQLADHSASRYTQIQAVALGGRRIDQHISDLVV